MFNPQRKLKWYFRRKISRFHAIKAVATFSKFSEEKIALSGKTIKETLQNKIIHEEKYWIRKVEALRRQLNSSKDEIEVKDYGAGKSNPGLTAKEMEEGQLDTRIIGEVCSKACKPYIWSLLLFKFIRNFKPTNCIELGTCLGISALYQAAALKLNGSGHLITLEGSSTLASLAAKHFRDFGLDNIVNVIVGRFSDTLSEVLKENPLVDYAFIDGHHDEEATLFYYNQIMCYTSKKALLIFDDISWSSGMKKAWQNIITDERLKICIDLGTMGVCIIDNDIEQKRNFSISFI